MQGGFHTKIAFFDTKPYDRAAFDRYRDRYSVTIKYYETKLNEDTAGLARGYDGVCVFVNDTVNSAVIDRLCQEGVSFVALRCAGFNNVDMCYAYGRIHILRVPAYSPYAIAEHAMALLLTSVRRIHKAYIRTKDFNFSLSGLTGFDLHGKTVGVIGTGRIGQAFIRICQGFGMRMLAYDRYPSATVCQNNFTQYVPLETLLSESDILSLHCPLNDDTYHMIDEKALLQCKRGVVIINTSRGALIDTEALLAGIKSRHVGAACLDVYEEESDWFFEDNSGHIMEDDTLARLITMPNVIVTSHQAFLTREALEEIAKTTLQNIVEFSKNGCCANELCYRQGSAEDCRSGKCF